jgi:hypothetical protein
VMSEDQKLKKEAVAVVISLFSRSIIGILKDNNVPIIEHTGTALRLAAFQLDQVVAKIDDPNTTMGQLKDFMDSKEFKAACDAELDRLLADKH